MRPRHVLATATLLVACGGASTADHAAPTEANGGSCTSGCSPPPAARYTDTIPPKVIDLGLTIAPYDSAAGRAGDFEFRLWPYAAGPIGAFARTAYDPEGHAKTLPSLDFFPARDVVVRAPFDGVVKWRRFQDDSKDWEILVSKHTRSPWYFDFDHLKTVFVDSGATVRAGQPIGIVRDNGNQGGFVELTVGRQDADLTFCPLSYADPARADSLGAAVRRLIAEYRAAAHATDTPTPTPLPACEALTAKP